MSATPGRRRSGQAAATNAPQAANAQAHPDRTARRARDRGRGARSRQPWWRGPWLIPAIVGLLVLVVVGLLIAGRQQSAAPSASQAETAQVVAAVTSIPASTFDAVGSGGLTNPLKPVQLSPLTGPNGHPEVLYVGAEYCPYCASERWSLIAALSRFGTFNGLQLTTSTDADVYPNTPTFTFAKSSYSSQYVDFVPVETETRSRAPLQAMTPAQQQLFNQLNPSGSIPFTDVGNRYTGVGSGYPNDVLAGKSWTDIAAALSNPSSPVARAILGNANYITAAICQATGGQPSEVCAAPGAVQAKAQLGG